MVGILFSTPKYPPKICANITCISSSSLPAALHLPLHCAGVEEEEGSLQLIQALNTDCCVHQRRFYFRTSTQNFCPIAARRAFNRTENQKDRFFIFFKKVRSSDAGGGGGDGIHRWRRVGTSAKTLNLLLCYRC